MKKHFNLCVFNGDRLFADYKFDDTLTNALFAFNDGCRRGGSVYLYIFNDETKAWDEFQKLERPDYV